jgi:UDP-glucose 4-epimerase
MGDLPEYYAQADYAQAALGWKAEHGIDRMCQDSWRWQSQNPKVFAD